MRKEFCSKGHSNWGNRKTGTRYCKTCRHEWNYNDRRNLRLTILAHYGGQCFCCGERRFEFLSLDHINGGGTKHRQSINTQGGWHFCRWIKKNNFPEGFQILCHNCNLAKGFYGRCPHERDRELARNDISEYYLQLAGWSGA